MAEKVSDHLASGRVAVVGGGVSGLAAAASLVEKGFDVVLLEASDYFGGRVKQVEPFPGFPPVDLGADFIHGSKSIIHELAKENDWNVKEAHGIGDNPGDILVHYNGELHPLHSEKNPDIAASYNLWDKIANIGHSLDMMDLSSTETDTRLHEMKDESACLINERTNDNLVASCACTCHCEDLEKLNFKDFQGVEEKVKELKCKYGQQNLRSVFRASDTSLSAWLADQDIPKRVWNIMESNYSQTSGAPLSRHGIMESAHEETCWPYGSGNYRLERSYSILVSHYVKSCAKVDMKLNWPVRELQWSGMSEPKPGHSENPGVILTNEQGESIDADYAIITVPLTILKDGDITFSPPLPREKLEAIDKIYMGAALKIVCRFKTRFWPVETQLVYAARGFLSQILMYSRDRHVDGEDCHVVVGFQTADLAAQKIHLSDDFMRDRFLEQLDNMFGTLDEPSPASLSLLNHVYYHWSKHPYVRGGYSAPTAHAYGLRHHLASPVSGRLFFAGEATHVTVPATVQSAIESGVRAVEEVYQAASRKQ